ncbi:MAG TPA: phosphatidate cytidylyltransferase [Nitratifractor sp.]|nr:phosphatidate cytidylyltransferase [Nitratifractor sp.]
MGSELNTRVKSALVMFAVVVVVGVLDIKFLTWLFLGGVTYYAYIEACKLWGVESSDSLSIALGVVWILAYFLDHPINALFLLVLVMASKLAYDKSIDKRLLLPMLYPVASFLFIWALYVQVGMVALVWLLVIVSLADIGAYYGGKKFGKHQFSPTSPNKTIEGVFSGVSLATVVGAIVIASSSEILFLPAILIAMLVAVASVFGDLFESYLKREAGVKDSGDTIPGHGGVLDRVDGYLFAAVMLYVLMHL